MYLFRQPTDCANTNNCGQLRRAPPGRLTGGDRDYRRDGRFPVNRRMNKSEQVCRSRRGADLLLAGSLRSLQWHARFRLRTEIPASHRSIPANGDRTRIFSIIPTASRTECRRNVQMSVPSKLEMSVSAAVWRAVEGDAGDGAKRERCRAEASRGVAGYRSWWAAGRALRYAGGFAPARRPTQTTCH